VELEEITSLRLMLLNILPKMLLGEKMTLEQYRELEETVTKQKLTRPVELLKDWQKRGGRP
jgi:hypothetical protein